jgi:SAM-dependent methyltransferase
MIARLKMLSRALASPPNVLLKRETIEAAAQRHGLLGGRILNIGSKNVRLGRDSVNLDVVPGPGVDVVGDAHELDRHFSEKSFDTVVLSAVLQYCEKPQRVIQQSYYVLKPGGMLLLDAPFLQPYCFDGLDLWRFSEDGLRKLCARYFEIIELKPSIATAPALALIIQHAASTKKNRIAAALLAWAATVLVYPLRYVPSSNSATAGAFLLVGRKLPVESTSNQGASLYHAKYVRTQALLVQKLLPTILPEAADSVQANPPGLLARHAAPIRFAERLANNAGLNTARDAARWLCSKGLASGRLIWVREDRFGQQYRAIVSRCSS